MECGRRMIYFSTYENGVKTKKSGYAGIFIRGNSCDVQLYYRGEAAVGEQGLSPVYMFLDGTVIQGDVILLEEGMAAATLHTNRLDFMQSGRRLEELEVIYLDGVSSGICGGRMDGQELTGELPVVTEEETVMTGLPMCEQEEEPDEEDEAAVYQLFEEEQQAVEVWSYSEFLERLPELRLPRDGVRQKCCRMALEDMAHLPEEQANLKENNFLLHGFYEYHHLLFAKLSCRYGERYVLGVPGDFCYRNQYMAENFGFYDFAPLEPGKRRGGCFGYWYYYLENQKQQTEMI